jgi:hypothetical protein
MISVMILTRPFSHVDSSALEDLDQLVDRVIAEGNHFLECGGK